MASKVELRDAYIALARLRGAVHCLERFYDLKYWARAQYKWAEFVPGLYCSAVAPAYHAWFNHAGKTYSIDIEKVGCLPSSLTEESIT